MNDFREGELILYHNGDFTWQIGKIKRLCEDGAFVYYTSGETASKTSYSNMRKLENAYVITATSLGGDQQEG